MKPTRLLSVLALSGLLSACGSAPVSAPPALSSPVPSPTSASAGKPVRIGVALGGGAAKGFAHIGVIKMLEANGFAPVVVSGTSAGSVVGALYASGMDGFQMQEKAVALDQTSIRDVRLFSGGLVQGQALQDYVNQQLGNKPIERLSKPFAAVATRLEDGERTVFVRGNAGQAVRASSSIPGVFEPVAIGQYHYVDGGVVSPVPVDAARQLGAEFVIAVDISSKASGRNPGDLLGTVNQSISINQSSSINLVPFGCANPANHGSLRKLLPANWGKIASGARCFGTIVAPKGDKGPAASSGPSGLAPADIQSAYGLPRLTATDSRATVAIVDAYDDPNAESDLATYRSQYGLPPCTTANGCFKKVNENGGSSLPSADAGWAEEESLDLDMVSAVCPNCHILLVEASQPTMDDLGTAVNTAVNLGAKFVSNSYGGSEDSSDTSSDSAYFDHPGVAITVSSGDSGYGAEYPAASRYVTAVGGTSLSRASNSRGWSETAWSGAGSATSASSCPPAPRSVSSRTPSTPPGSPTGPRPPRSSTARGRSATCSWCCKQSTTPPTSSRW